MHRILSRCPDNNIPHKGAIRKPNKCENPQLIHNSIHKPSPYLATEFIKPSKTWEIFPNLHSSIIPVGQLCDNESIVTFDNHKFIVSKNKDIIIEVYRYPTNGFWRLPLHNPAQNTKQVNMLEPRLCNHIRQMAPWHPISYHPTSQKDLENFNHQILCCPTKYTLLQAINDGSFWTQPGLTDKII